MHATPSATPLFLLIAVLALTARADDLRPLAAMWKETATLSAPEANQAAAADDRHVYAIGNRSIAKYDRATGERLATSTGEAHHLNSGFLFEGQLYCAHSNYPRQPERSEILRLDPESMRLTTFKEFGNYGGSLTWAVRRDGRWWCNFARYGKANGETFLVELDDEWRELRRYTYPPAVTENLGSYSISGGVWHGGLLLVTDHDHRRLYRLRLPEKGSVLDFFDIVPAPFTGQGIAHDSKTGGLVGIRRTRREIVMAARNHATNARRDDAGSMP